MEQYISEFLTLAGVHLLAVISPGPDFVMIVRQALVYSRRVGLYSAIGLGLGILVHVGYSLAGIGLIISQSILLFSIFKFAAAGYLIWIGYHGITAKKSSESSDQIKTTDASIEHISNWRAIKTGFLTNVFNPKATLFFLSLFTLIVSPTTPLWVQALYGLEMATMTAIWFGIVAFFLSNGAIQRKFVRIRHWIDRVTGAALIGLGIKVALSTQEK
jgi:RhtB (resistance to homoserine/threonine) family protein